MTRYYNTAPGGARKKQFDDSKGDASQRCSHDRSWIRLQQASTAMFLCSLLPALCCICKIAAELGTLKFAG